jgi:phospholipid/cholesterol/gamma-HCH transport system substrate-binding protein
MSFRRNVARHLRELVAICGFMLIAAVVAAYIMDHQRIRWPWEKVMHIEAEFSSAQAVTPGQGQTVNVAGVRVGEIGDVRLREGRAVVRLDLDSEELGPVYRNARMLLRPKTGLNDMSVQLDPGTPDPALPDQGRLGEGDRVPAANTAPSVNPDEVFAALDADTRRYVAILANAGGQALGPNGLDLRRLLKAAEPTLEQTNRVTSAIASRRRELRRLVTNLHRLSRAAASKDDELASLVQAASASFGAIGTREAELSSAIDRLPGALTQTGRALRAAHTLAGELQPAATDLEPVARDLAPALRDARPLITDALPVVRDDLRPLVREAVPLLRDLRPSVAGIDESTPPLTRAAKVLNRVVNELGYNPPGPEEGYLFWTSWFVHNANSILTVEDAHGGTWRGLVMFGCSTAGEVIKNVPALSPNGEAPTCPKDPAG